MDTGVQTESESDTSEKPNPDPQLWSLQGAQYLFSGREGGGSVKRNFAKAFDIVIFQPHNWLFSEFIHML